MWFFVKDTVLKVPPQKKSHIDKSGDQGTLSKREIICLGNIRLRAVIAMFAAYDFVLSCWSQKRFKGIRRLLSCGFKHTNVSSRINSKCGPVLLKNKVQ